MHLRENHGSFSSNRGFVFGMMGVVFGILGVAAFVRLEISTKTLKEDGILGENYKLARSIKRNNAPFQNTQCQRNR